MFPNIFMPTVLRVHQSKLMCPKLLPSGATMINSGWVNNSGGGVSSNKVIVETHIASDVMCNLLQADH